MRGNPDAVASAYSLDDYRIADDLGGEAAYANLRDRGLGARHPPRQRHGAQPHGHRFALGHRASRLVPVGRRSRRSRPTPSTGPTSRPTSASAIVSRTTTGTTATPRSSSSASTAGAATRATSTTATTARASRGTTRRSSTTSSPRSASRSSRPSSHVARRFPIIRFDAAMILAKQHIQRLWFPEPGQRRRHPVARRARA